MWEEKVKARIILLAREVSAVQGQGEAQGWGQAHVSLEELQLISCQVNINFIVITAKAPGMLPVRWRLPSVLHVFAHFCSPRSCEVGTNFIPVVLETLVPAEQV